MESYDSDCLGPNDTSHPGSRTSSESNDSTSAESTLDSSFGGTSKSSSYKESSPGSDSQRLETR